jgi:hypothetical protein
MSTQEGLLQASSNRGRYELDSSGGDLTSGDRCDLWLGGRWIAGNIEHTGRLYADASTGRALGGYYFVANDGGVCGLCVGMRVRVKV